MPSSFAMPWLRGGGCAAVLAAVMAVCLPASPAAAVSDRDCQRPKPPEIPDGKTASQIDMISTKERVKLYVQSGTAFLECLDEASENLGSVSRDRVLARIEKKRTEMTDEMAQIAEALNVQIRIYNELGIADEAGSDAPDSAAPAEPGAPAMSPGAAPVPETAEPAPTQGMSDPVGSGTP
jgi:hypothetical protein